MLDPTIVRKVELARYLYKLAEDNLRSASDLALFAAVNMLQDAVEVFLLAVADHVNAGIRPTIGFPQYFDLINDKIENDLPFQPRLMQLNRLRVGSKHYAIKPPKEECEGIIVAVREFFEHVSSSVLEVDFATVSLVDLLDEGETKELLKTAEKEFKDESYINCLISCRKAIFIEIEQYYNIEHYRSTYSRNTLLGLKATCYAPEYAKNEEYINQRVENPTDFLVYDISHLNQEIMKYGVDNTTFWNVMSQTPKVYRVAPNKEWVVKEDFNKMVEEGIKDRAQYVLSNTVDIILSIHIKKRAVKFPTWIAYKINLKRDGVPVYQNADKQSPIRGQTQKGLKQINSYFRVSGLNDKGPYWHVSDFGVTPYIWGYIHDEEVDGLES